MNLTCHCGKILHCDTEEPWNTIVQCDGCMASHNWDLMERPLEEAEEPCIRTRVTMWEKTP